MNFLNCACGLACNQFGLSFSSFAQTAVIGECNQICRRLNPLELITWSCSNKPKSDLPIDLKMFWLDVVGLSFILILFQFCGSFRNLAFLLASASFLFQSSNSISHPCYGKTFLNIQMNNKTNPAASGSKLDLSAIERFIWIFISDEIW